LGRGGWRLQETAERRADALLEVDLRVAGRLERTVPPVARVHVGIGHGPGAWRVLLPGHGGGLLLGGRILRALASMAPWAGYQRGGTTNIDGLACAIRAGE